MKRLREVQALWPKIQRSQPPEGGPKKLHGIDLAQLESTTRSLLDGYLKSEAKLPADQAKLLDRCAMELDLVHRDMRGDLLDHFMLLRRAVRVAMQDSN